MAIFFNKSWPYGYESSFTGVSGIYQEVVGGGAHTLALSSNRIFGSGMNYYGQLGLGLSGYNVNAQTFTNYFSDEKFLTIKCGYYQSYALSANGKWMACGRMGSGNEDFLGITLPGYQQVDYSGVDNLRSRWTKMANGYDSWLPENLYVGDFHLAALSGNTIYTVGNNGYGQRGPITTNNFTSGGVLYTWPGWSPISGKWNKLAESVNTRTTIALSGDMWFGCGSISNGELGLDLSDNSSDMIPITGYGKWDRVISAFHRTYALSGTKWYVTGMNNHGQLGLGDTLTRKQFTLISGDWKDIVPGDYHTFALSSNGVWFGCGRNLEGQLGLENTSYNNFTEVMNGVNFVSKIVTGVGTSFALINQDNYQPPSTGLLYTFGGKNIISFTGINIGLI